MKTYKGYLIDLDGTMYRGVEEIKEASSFIDRLKEKRIPYLFVTNNSSRTPAQVAEKLNSFRISATPEQVFTASTATANYMFEQKPQAAVYMIGEEGLRSALCEKGFTLVEHERPDFVVCGIDRSITYEKLATACLAVRNGAGFISTNSDAAIPTERGLLPGNGSLTSVIAVSTGTAPTFVGKPEAIIMEQALQVLGTKKEETLMVGDNYQTDILAGIHAGIDTLLVHTGVTKKEHLVHIEQQPRYTRNNLDEWEI
ncbi:TIGR01457 family HAD-type hydrolase [Pseudobacillus sp. 179-B 2D1 NHS]|uniref:TIGR01457 family HAD-type hydrolase n=1 Tax=Pseudobacillus sp. 179-B 2D1 NHS TaxID=3374292 RepID=UPI00387A7BE9